MAGDLSALREVLAPWCDRLEDRLLGSEPYRALTQLLAREANGAPVQSIASAEVRAHLEHELATSQDFRVLNLLRLLLAELHEANDATASPARTDAGMRKAALPPLAGTATDAEPKEVSEPVVDAVLAEPHWQSGDLQNEATAAVATVFGATSRPASAPEVLLPVPDQPAVEVAPAVPESRPVELQPIAAEPPAATPEPARVAVSAPVLPSHSALPPPPLVPVMIAKAEATVMASLAKLRAAEAEAAKASTAAATLPPEVKSPSTSMEGTMANVTAAVAATVAAANRIAEPKSARPPSPPPAAPVAKPLGSGFRSAAPAPAAATEATEIRFVARPASPMLDIAPRVKPVPLADVPVAPLVPLRPAAVPGEGLSRDWEEAVVEIRRAAPILKPTAEPTSNASAGDIAGRAGVVFGRFVKSLKGGEKT